MVVPGRLGRWSGLGRALLAGAACAWLGWALTGWLGEKSGPLVVVARETARGEALEAECVAAQQRLEARKRIFRDVAEGRLTLAEGRERLAAVLREWPGYASVARQLDREGPEEERLTRQILEQVRLLLADRPGKAAVLRALERELSEGARLPGGVEPTSATASPAQQ
jgi:hypothetical protein